MLATTTTGAVYAVDSEKDSRAIISVRGNNSAGTSANSAHSKALQHTQTLLDDLQERSLEAGFAYMDRWESVLAPPRALLSGAPVDRSDPSTFSDLQLLGLYRQYDNSVRNAEEQLKELDASLDNLWETIQRPDFHVTPKLYQHYMETLNLGLTKRKDYELGIHYLNLEREKWRDEFRRRGAVLPNALVGSVFQSEEESLEGLLKEYHQHSEDRTADALLPVGAQNSLLERHRRQVRIARTDLEKKKKLRDRVARFLERKNLSTEQKEGGRKLLKDVKSAIVERGQEIRGLREEIAQIIRGDKSDREIRYRMLRSKGGRGMRLPNVPTHAIGDLMTAGDEYDDLLSPIGFSLSKNKMQKWAEDKKRQYKQKMKKWDKAAQDGGWTGIRKADLETDRDREGKAIKQAKKEETLAKKAQKREERMRKKAKTQADRSARERRRAGVRAARKREAEVRKQVKQRTSREVAAAKRNLAAAKRQANVQIKRARRQAAKEMNMAKRQRQADAKRERTGERKELGRARKTLGKPSAGGKKRVEAAKKGVMGARASRERRIKKDKRREAVEDKLMSLAGDAFHKQVVGELLDEMDEAVRAGPLFSGAPVNTSFATDEGEEAELILKHYPHYDPSMNRMVTEYVGSLINDGAHDATPPATNIARYIQSEYEDLSLADTWLDLHKFIASRMSNKEAFPDGHTVAGSLVEAAEEAVLAAQLLSGADFDDLDDDKDAPTTAEDAAAELIAKHFPYHDPDMDRMISEYVGTWVSAAVGSEYCLATQMAGLSTDDLHDVLDAHAEDIAERIDSEYGDPLLAETWRDFHHTTAALIRDEVVDRALISGKLEYGDSVCDHAIIASALYKEGNQIPDTTTATDYDDYDDYDDDYDDGALMTARIASVGMDPANLDGAPHGPHVPIRRMRYDDWRNVRRPHGNRDPYHGLRQALKYDVAPGHGRYDSDPNVFTTPPNRLSANERRRR
jgi:hypothetical protein